MASYMLWSGILLTELTGVQGDYFSVFAPICNVDDLQAEAVSDKNEYFVYELHVLKCLVAFWNGDYISAEKHSHNASAMMPVSQTPNELSFLSDFLWGTCCFSNVPAGWWRAEIAEGQRVDGKNGKVGRCVNGCV